MRHLLLTLATLCLPYSLYAQPVQQNDTFDFFCGTEEVQMPYALRDKDLVWKPENLPGTGSTLGDLRIRVEFLDGDPSWKRFVEQIANEWTRGDAAAGVHWVFDSGQKGHIRIAFVDHLKKNPRSWTGNQAINDNLDADKTTGIRETMLLPQGPYVDPKYIQYAKRTIRHEFGHALGLLHEHLHPHLKLQWKPEIILNDLFGKAWCPEEEGEDKCKTKIENQITMRATSGHICPGTPKFDINSVMLYPIKEKYYEPVAGFSFPDNSDISRDDNICVNGLYPKKTVEPNRPPVRPVSQFRKMYRSCADKNLYTCKPVSVLEDNDEYFTVKSYGEPWGTTIWTWKKKADGSLLLLSARENNGTQITCFGSLHKKHNYLHGHIGWPYPCHGDAYIRIGSRCP